MRFPIAALLFAAALPALAQPSAKDSGKSAAGAPFPAMAVKAVAAKIAPAIDEANAVGNLRADEAITIRPEIAGRIVSMPFKEGENVKKGDLLAALDAAEFRAILASSAAQATLEQQRLERSEDLFKKGFISQQALDESRSTLARSKAKLAEDEARLARTEIRAPFPGVVGLRQVSEGAFVAAGTDIARLEKIDQLKCDFRVPENFLGRLKGNQNVRIQVDAYAADTFNGAVYAIEPGVDEQTRTVLVRARVLNAGLKLRPGMFARVYLQLAVREKAVWIPEAAIVPRGQASTVFRIVDGKAQLIEVQTGARRVGEVEIVKGIGAGDLVITEGTQRIGPGSAVQLMAQNPAVKPAAGAGAPGK
ncbi:MAG: efflux RND transporter periplasmic adaptor subunit [Betaproteobacteria bacterium]|nr:efflux RND transporter periplasmic adaptor subunit [Betaproteobacteria bacterium]